MTQPENSPRWAKDHLSDGVDPDARFSLANERTFLAWIRTALGMIALGIGIATFVSSHVSATDGKNATYYMSVLIAIALVLLGGLVSGMSWLRWLRVEQSMRAQQGIPAPRLAPLLAIGISAIAVLAVVAVALRM